MGAASCILAFAYWSRSKRVTQPAIDLALMGIKSFKAGTIFGGLGRVGLNAVPFLLPLHLQLNMDYSPSTAGAVMALAVLGAVVIKPLNGRLLHAFGFKTLLIGTLVIAALLVAAFAIYRAPPPLWVLGLHVVAFDFVRTILFNSFGILSFSDVPQQRQSSSVGLASLIQQLSMGMGVSLSALVLSVAGSNQQPDYSGFGFAFLIAGSVVVLAAAAFFSIPSNTGDGVLRRTLRSPES